jgi:large subunit ribosomal protein L24e
MKPGTGLLFVKKEGTPFFFCSRKCEKNLLLLKRKPTSLKWTVAFRAGKEALSGATVAKAEKAKTAVETIKLEKEARTERKEVAAAKSGKQAMQKKKRVRRKKKK